MAIPYLINIDMNQNQVLNMVLQNLASDPSAPVEGQVWVNTTSHTIKWYDGTAVRILAVLTNTLDQFGAPGADVSFNSKKITNLATPTAATDAATKGYVDALALGLDVKASCRAATAVALSAYSYVTGVITASGNGALVIDGVTVAVNDRVLLKNGAANSDNGIYVVTATGDGSSPFVLTRAADCDSTAEYTSGAFTFIEEGSSNQGYAFVVSTQGTIVVGTTAISWVKFSAGVGGGISKFSLTIGNGSATSFVINHAFSSKDVQVQVYSLVSPYRQVMVEIQYTDTNNVTILFGAAPDTDSYRVVVEG